MPPCALIVTVVPDGVVTVLSVTPVPATRTGLYVSQLDLLTNLASLDLHFQKVLLIDT